MSIAIVTDSTADIPHKIAEELHIQIIPNILILDGQTFKDGIDISRREFYERLPYLNTPPTTSTASPGAYSQLFGDLFAEGYEHIISINVSKHFSGVLNAASTAAQPFGDRISVIDSEQVTLGMGFQVISAAESAMADRPLQEILKQLDSLKKRARVFAMLDTLEYLHRSGRVSWARARIGNLLRVKPFIEVTGGKAISIGDVRTRRKGVNRLLSMINNLGEVERLAFLHTNAENDARYIMDTCGLEIPHEPMIINVTTTIGTHVGPNGLGFAALVK